MNLKKKMIDLMRIGISFEYTRKYKEFCDEMDAKYGSYSTYLQMRKEPI